MIFHILVLFKFCIFEYTVRVQQHPVEFRRKTISTTPLLSLVLENTKVLVGRSFDRQSRLASILEAATMDENKNDDDDDDDDNNNNQSRIPLLLFPGHDAITLEDPDSIERIRNLNCGIGTRKESSTFVGTDDTVVGDDSEGIIEAMKSIEGPKTRRKNKYLLIIVDGTWTQAKRMVRYSPILQEKCQQIQFTSTAASSRSIYDSIRKQPGDYCLSTLESCSRTLNLLEQGQEGGNEYHNNESENRKAVKEATKYLHSALQALVCIQIVQERKHLAKYPNSIRNEDKIHEKKVRQKEMIKSELLQTLTNREDFETSTDDVHDNVQDNDEQITIEKTCNENAHGIVQNIQGGEFQFRKALDGENPNLFLRNLQVEDAKWVDSRWPYRSNKSLRVIERQIKADNINATQTGSSCCLGIEHEGELIGCIFRHRNGSLGILHVDEAYRRKGYGTILLQEASRTLMKRNESPTCYIVDGNTKSEELFKSLGWVKENANAPRGTGKRRAKRKWIRII